MGAPYLVDNFDQVLRLTGSPLFKGWVDKLRNAANLQVLAFDWFQGHRHVLTNVSVKTPADLKGIRMRTPGAPVWLGQGGSGLTAMPVPVEAGACYVAVVAATRGRMRQLALRASVGALESADERGAQEEGAAIAFCARDRRFVRLEVEARGANPTWALALHRVQSGVWELKR